MILGLLFIAIIWCLHGFLSYKQVVHGNVHIILVAIMCLSSQTAHHIIYIL